MPLHPHTVAVTNLPQPIPIEKLVKCKMQYVPAASSVRYHTLNPPALILIQRQPRVSAVAQALLGHKLRWPGLRPRRPATWGPRRHPRHHRAARSCSLSYDGRSARWRRASRRPHPYHRPPCGFYATKRSRPKPAVTAERDERAPGGSREGARLLLREGEYFRIGARSSPVLPLVRVVRVTGGSRDPVSCAI